MLCSKCDTDLSDNSQSCPQCGEPVTPAANPTATALAISTGSTVCTKCRTTLPAGSQFCLKCGQPVTSEAIDVTASTVPAKVLTVGVPPIRKKRKRPVATWVLLLFLIGIVWWIAVSGNPSAKELRDEIAGARTQVIVETPFSVKPRSFAYYKFAVPPGAVSVAVTGQFNTTVTGPINLAKGADSNIEGYVLTEAAFAVWQSGYSTSTHYESGRVKQGTINAALPSGTGVYYLVFSNKFSPHIEKSVQATVFLQYKTWLPEWILQLKQSLWNWMGLS